MIHGTLGNIRNGDDERRLITEHSSSEGGFTYNRFFIKSTDAGPLGNHYHSEKTEDFLILKGGGKFIGQMVDEKEQVIGERIELLLTENSVVQVPPRLVHVFVLEKGSEMVCHSNKPFDFDDMHTWKLL